jgi:hypothetical protein
MQARPQWGDKSARRTSRRALQVLQGHVRSFQRALDQRDERLPFFDDNVASSAPLTLPMFLAN